MKKLKKEIRKYENLILSQWKIYVGVKMVSHKKPHNVLTG